MEDEEYLEHVQKEITDDLENVPTQSDGWAVKIVFVNVVSDKRVAGMAPYLFPLQMQAIQFGLTIAEDDRFGDIIAEWLARGLIDLEEGTWMPLFTKAVKLAVVPF